MAICSPAGKRSCVQPERRSVCTDRISQRCFETFPPASVTSKYSQPWGLKNSTFVSLAPAKLTVSLRVVGVRADGMHLIEAEMVDMETYAVLRACQRFGLPLIALRGISDGDRELGSIADWTQYLGIIDVKLAQAVDRLEAAIADGSLTWGDMPEV